MRTAIILASAAFLVSTPLMAAARTDPPVKLGVQKQKNGQGVKVRAGVLHSKTNGTHRSLANTRTGVSVLGGRNSHNASAGGLHTNSSVLKTRNDSSKTSLASPNAGARAAPANNGPASVNTKRTTVANAPVAGAH